MMTQEAWLRWEGGCAPSILGHGSPGRLGWLHRRGRRCHASLVPSCAVLPPDTLVSEIRHVVHCHLWLSQQRFSLCPCHQGAEPPCLGVSALLGCVLWFGCHHWFLVLCCRHRSRSRSRERRSRSRDRGRGGGGGGGGGRERDRRRSRDRERSGRF